MRIGRRTVVQVVALLASVIFISRLGLLHPHSGQSEAADGHRGPSAGSAALLEAMKSERGPPGSSLSVVVYISDTDADRGAFSLEAQSILVDETWRRHADGDASADGPALEGRPELVLLVAATSAEPLWDAAALSSTLLSVDVKTIHLKDGASQAEAWNLGAHLARHDLIVFHRWQARDWLPLPRHAAHVHVAAPDKERFCGVASIGIYRRLLFTARLFDARARTLPCYDYDLLQRLPETPGVTVTVVADKGVSADAVFSWRVAVEQMRQRLAVLPLWPSLRAANTANYKCEARAATAGSHFACATVEAVPDWLSPLSSSERAALLGQARTRVLNSMGTRLAPHVIARYHSEAALLRHHELESAALGAPGTRFLVVQAENGLGNRMRAIASAYAVAALAGRRLRVVWMPDEHLDVPFEQLFRGVGPACAPLDIVPEMHLDEVDGAQRYDLYDYMSRKAGAKDAFIDVSSPRHIVVRSAFVLNATASMEQVRAALRSLCPSAAVAAAMAPYEERVKKAIGVHIRAESDLTLDVDALPRTAYTTAELFAMITYREGCHPQRFVAAMRRLVAQAAAAGAQPPTFFVTADTLAAYDLVLGHFPSLAFADRQVCTARGPRCVQHALAHMLLLARCTDVLGSAYSSFSEVASLISTRARFTSPCDTAGAAEQVQRADPESVRLALSLQSAWQSCLPGDIHLVLSYFVVQSGHADDDVDARAAARARQREYDDAIQRNLLHPDVAAVHLVCDDEAARGRARVELRDPCDKLVLSLRNRSSEDAEPSPTYGALFAYAARAVERDAAVMVLNADIYLGTGFGEYNPARHHSGLVYALTRWERPGLAGAVEDGLCGEDLCPRYRPTEDGFLSHDAFLYRNPMMPAVIKAANYSSQWGGAENVLVHHLKNKGGYRVKNACFKLRIHHNHCSGLRSWTDQRAGADSGWRHDKGRLDHMLCDGKWHCGDGYVEEGPTDQL